MKACNRCGEVKPREGFNNDRAKRDGLSTLCRVCKRKTGAAWRKRNPDYMKRYYQKNLSYFRAHNEAFRRNNPAYLRQWQQANAELNNEYARRYRARKLAGGVAIDPALLEQKLLYWGGCCWMCGGPAVEWDHVKPLSKGGQHLLANLRPACRSCNASKNARWPYGACA